LTVAIIGMMTYAQTPLELENARRASCKVHVGAKFKAVTIPMTVNGKDIEVIETPPSWGSAGSGTIVGRSLTQEKGKPKWTYWIMTARHLFPTNFKGAIKRSIWVHFFSFKGIDDVAIKAGARFWISPNKQVDVAFVGFYSEEELPIMPVVRDLPKNLFGVKYIAIGHPFAVTPFIREGRFSVNHPVEWCKDSTIGCGSPFAKGMSGGGLFIMNKNRFSLAAIVTAYLGGDWRSPERFGIATRIDSILKLLKTEKKLKYVEIE